MQINSSLVYNLQNEYKKKPVNHETAVPILCELMAVDAEAEVVNAQDFYIRLSNLLELFSKKFASDIEKANQSETTRFIKANKLAILLQNNPYLLEEFDVIEDDVADTIKISWRGKTDKPTVFRGYDYLRIELRRFIGNAEFDNSAIARAITQAKNYQRYDREFLECDTLQSLIIEKAYALIASHPNKKKITIPELRKTISSTEISNKEAEDVLLNAGWEIFKSGTCPTKFFRPKY